LVKVGRNKITFKCLRCGRCCKNLLKNVGGILLGLGLMPQERKFFPTELVSPQAGIGLAENDPTKPKHVLTYQLNVKYCPHLSENGCKIYENRPLSCRGFPLISMGNYGTTIAEPSDCLFVERVEAKIGSLNALLPLTPKRFRAPSEWMAIRKWNRDFVVLLKRHIDDARTFWNYDLKTGKWQIQIHV